MNVEDSIVIAEFTRRINALVAQTRVAVTTDDVVTIQQAMFCDANITPIPMRKRIATEFKAAVTEQVLAERQLHREISREWRSAFGALDKCISLVAFLNSRLIQLMGRNLAVLDSKDPRSRAESGPDEAVTGATLKCFLLASLLSRSCGVGAEISCLLRSGLASGAQARLRSLHEISVVIQLLCNDHTYELAERYQDHAIYEMLKDLRAQVRVLEQPMWETVPGTEQTLADMTTEAEAAAQAARSRWGAAMSEQYGWARPVIDDGDRPRRQITFADLESAAGADFLRADYLSQNHHIHAGPYATINHLLDSRPPSHGWRDDDMMQIIGHRTLFILECSLQVISIAICAETEEYDEILYSYELTPFFEVAQKRLRECHSSVSSS
jgi:hypothetical protein